MSDEAAARLIERVLSDAAFRARFRSDPEAAAREAGLDEPVAEGAMETLEIRESRSSLAGAMMAAAVEGIGLYDLLDGVGQAGAPSGSAPAADQVELGDDAGAPDTDAADEPSDDETDSSDDDTDSSDDDTDSSDDDDDDDEDEDEPDEEEPDEDEPDEDEDEDDEDADDEGDDEDEDDEDDGSSDGDDPDDSDAPEDDAAPAPGTLGDVDPDYPGDQAGQERIARWMAAEAQRRGLPPELPVMASLVESGMRNLPGGDADSVGFFQMRVGIWNRGAYAGYPQDPAKQLDWFLDTAEAVKAQRIARGAPIDDPRAFGEWIADVERPAEQYRGRYQLRLEEARRLLAAFEQEAQADTGAGPRARAALAEAREFLGTPYRWGGSTPQTGFDCSGLVQWAYAQAGIRIPRVTHEQILAPGATKIGRDDLLPGDLVFFRDDTGYVHHVGMSLGGQRFIHAPRTGDVVKISRLDEPYYAKEFAGGRRFDRAVVDAPAARAALARDADEVNRPGTALFRALEMQERRSGANEVQVLPAIRPDQIRR